MIPELLAPAGNMESLRAALHYGADAVYGAMERYGLRAFAGNFSPEELREAVRLTHGAGAKFYLTLNIFPSDSQLEGMTEAARLALETGVDAAIVGDLGAICTLRERVPELPVHVSTQASACNTAAAAHYRALGCRRIILAREMRLQDIRQMRRNLPGDIELETFVHGASCMAWSGRCMLSAALTGRSANQGACAQPCRWEYAVMERQRPGEYLPVAEDEHGTYIFSAKDLNLMPLLPELTAAGISSLKIEGRMKTEYYVGTVTAAYRRGLNLLRDGGEAAFRDALPEMLAELECASHRASDTGFMLGAPEAPGGAEGFHQSREYVARVLETAPDGARLLLKNRFRAGDALELLTPRGVLPVTAQPFLREKTGETLDTLGIAGEIVRMPMPQGAAPGDILRGPVRNHRQ